MYILIDILKFLIVIVPILLTVATLTLFERKVMAAIQIRRGPNVIGFGLLQPLADGLKLLIKELIIPLKGNKYLFLISPVLFLALSFASWSVIPFETHAVASPNLAILVFLAFSSLSVYGILLGGWSSNSRYAFLGALRSASQMISYELVLSLLILLVCILSQSFNFIDIVLSQTAIWYFIPLLPFVLIYMIAILAETNRTPFDLPEAEAELVAGYSVEYSSGPFAFYFIAEYCNLIIWSHITTILFLGGWLSSSLSIFLPYYFIFSMKSLFILLLFCWIRAALPRYRWDQLLVLAWRTYLPLVLLGVLFILFLFNFFNESTYILSIMPFISKKYNLNIKSVIIYYSFINFIVFLGSSLADCDTTNKEATFIDFSIIETFNQQELQQFNDFLVQEFPENEQQSNLLSRILLAVVINVGIYIIVRYGPSIFNSIVENINNISQDTANGFLNTARQAARTRVIQLAEDPQNVERLQNAIRQIVELRPQNLHA